MQIKQIPAFILLLLLATAVMAEEKPFLPESPQESNGSISPAAAVSKSKFLVKKSVNLDIARRIALAAELKARELGTTVAITVLDASQDIKIEYVMDGQSSIALEWARAKALSALEFVQPTNKGDFKVLNIGNKTMVLGAGGGYPLLYEGELLGAIGVSGTRGQEDDIIAQHAQNEFNKAFIK